MMDIASSPTRALAIAEGVAAAAVWAPLLLLRVSPEEASAAFDEVAISGMAGSDALFWFETEATRVFRASYLEEEIVGLGLGAPALCGAGGPRVRVFSAVARPVAAPVTRRGWGLLPDRGVPRSWRVSGTHRRRAPLGGGARRLCAAAGDGAVLAENAGYLL